MPHWPVEHGGTGWTPVQRYIFDLECGRAGAAIYNASGSHFVGPVIIHYGTQEQKEKYLPRIRSGEDYWAQGYSEPGSGSDLASLKTKAESDGDDYVVTGQKIWTTNAHHANCLFALVRTSTTGKRQEGITFLLIDMDTPGVSVRPIIGNGGDHEFNEVFFDRARIPKSNRIGEENKGWEVAKYLLGIRARRQVLGRPGARAVCQARAADGRALPRRREHPHPPGRDRHRPRRHGDDRHFHALGAAGRRQSRTDLLAAQAALERDPPVDRRARHGRHRRGRARLASRAAAL